MPLSPPISTCGRGERCAALCQLGFPCERNRECSSLSLFSTSKETKAKERRKEERGGEKEKTAAGQEREHDKGKSQRERNCREWEEVYEMCRLYMAAKLKEKKNGYTDFQPPVLLRSSIIFKEQEN